MTAVRYGWTAMALHWVVAGLIVVQYVLANRAEDLPLGMEKLQLLAQHKSFGITILALAVVRLIWRFVSPPPPLPQTMPTWQRRAAVGAHWLLYGLLFALPLTGWIYSSMENFPVSWFNLVQLPDLVGPNEELAHSVEEVHETLAKLLFLLALVHIGAALKHQFVDRDGLLLRMLPMPGGGSAADEDTGA